MKKTRGRRSTLSNLCSPQGTGSQLRPRKIVKRSQPMCQILPCRIVQTHRPNEHASGHAVIRTLTWQHNAKSKLPARLPARHAIAIKFPLLAMQPSNAWHKHAKSNQPAHQNGCKKTWHAHLNQLSHQLASTCAVPVHLRRSTGLLEDASRMMWK